MEFKHYKMISSVKKHWNNIFDVGSEDIYQSYKFNKLCFWYRVTSLSNIKRKNIMCDFVVGFDKNLPVCIAPLVIDVTPQKCIRLLGHGTNAGYLDFIYKDSKYVEEMYRYICKYYIAYEQEFIFVKESSPLYRLMVSSEIFNNYAIRIDTYDEYFASLSKSTRQNIRTAYNRMNTDEITYELKVFEGGTSSVKDVLVELNEIYHKRKADWIDDVPQFTERTKKIVLKRDVINQSARKDPRTKTVCLYLNNKPAAYFIGLTYNGGICIPRLAIDTEYGRYSPGVVLIVEYLKRQNIGTSYVFDLCRGDEKYKSSLRGEISVTHRLIKQ